ncbi:MAG: bile acid:sodium symporter [Erythrobacter sp.]|nr:bile acid:sodium symporter [Erythrobacter sp.]
MVRTLISDPMLRMLVVAVALAAALPATGHARSILQMAANVGIFVLFLLNGMRIARREILAGAANLRFIGPLILWCFGAMALLGLCFYRAAPASIPPLVAIGFLYLGVLPTTIQSSTSYSSLANGNVALSVIAAALLSILGVFISVPLFIALGGTGDGAVGSYAVIKIIMILIVPFAIGQVVQMRTRGFISAHKPKIIWLDRGVIALAVYVAFSGAVEQGIWTRIDPEGWLWTAALVLALITMGHIGAWLAAKALGLSFEDRISFLFAGGQKSAALGAPLATILFKPSMAGFIVLPLLLYHLYQLVLAAPLASRLRLSPRPDSDDCTAPTTGN